MPLLDNMKSKVVGKPDGNHFVGDHWTTEATETYSTEQEAQGCSAVSQALHAEQCAKAHLHTGCSSLTPCGSNSPVDEGRQTLFQSKALYAAGKFLCTRATCRLSEAPQTTAPLAFMRVYAAASLHGRSTAELACVVKNQAQRHTSGSLQSNVMI